MSIIACDKCGMSIDTDVDDECWVHWQDKRYKNPEYYEWRVLCPSCRERKDETERRAKTEDV